MKIEKLYTLSQFVDLLIKLDKSTSYKYFLIGKYNDFLKTPLKKEMFVNEIEKPNNKGFGIKTGYKKEFRIWQEAEKKVIFETHLTQDYINNYLKVSTLGQLAEKADLKLKNVTL